ncbi:unnamed protein product [Didymodactylos carnosus]|uniref:Protein kinase domain-containing protein n=1 Tax=Didymodactylos carnosus TaxID=1234261 RepID=A0A815PM19_9BILA|nr:unnamed protein product [Didymodactylos carnosus]CAF4324670.1 unnamed protein product [Didymodactylos carnosus]
MSTDTQLQNLLGLEQNIDDDVLTNFQDCLNKLHHSEDKENNNILMTQIIDKLNKFLEENLTVLQTINRDRRTKFSDSILDQIASIKQYGIDEERWTKLKELISVCRFDLDKQPLSFVIKGVDCLNSISECETKHLDLIQHLNIDEILVEQYRTIRDGHKHPLVIICLGLTSKTGSFINFLEHEIIMAENSQESTVTKISNGKKTRTTNNEEVPVEINEIITEEITVKILKDIELWNIPLFDEEDMKIDEILDNADLIFLSISHDDFGAAADFLKSRLKTTMDNIVCLLDISHSGGIDETATLKQFQIEFGDNLNIIAIDQNCSRIRQKCIEQSARWLQINTQTIVELRLNYLLSTLHELLDYNNIDRTLGHYHQVNRIFNRYYSLFISSFLNLFKEQMDDAFNEIMNDDVNNILTECNSHLDNKDVLVEDIEELIVNKIVDKYKYILNRKEQQIQEKIIILFQKFSSSLKFSPPEEQIIEQVILEEVMNPYKMGVGKCDNFSKVRGLNGFLFANILLQEILSDWSLVCNFGTFEGIDNFIGAWSAGFFFPGAREKDDFTEQLKPNIIEVVRCCALEIQKQQTLVLRQLLSQISRKINNRLDEKIQKFVSIEKTVISRSIQRHMTYITELYLDIAEKQCNSTYKEYIRTDFQLNHDVFGGQLLLIDNRHVDLVFKKVTLDQINLAEIRYIRQFAHQNIVQYFDIKKLSSEPNTYFLIMERMDSDLATYIRQQLYNMNATSISKLFFQITNGLLKNTAPPRYVIADFGLIQRTPPTLIGTDGYLAPEIFSPRLGPITDKSDVYSLGNLIQFVIRKSPHHLRNNRLLQKWTDISKNCLNRKAVARPTCAEIIKNFNRNN